MDRVIKFRGKSTSKNQGHKWLYGGATGTGRDFIVDVTVDGYLGKGIFCPVIPETFGQFTGFLDVDGKEIFEDDFIQNQEHSELVYRVKVIDGCWSGVDVEDSFQELKYFDLDWLLIRAPFKVIGNVHDNPELLSGGGVK